MKFSYQWIRELVPGLNIEPHELQRLITMKTAECEGIEPAGDPPSDWIIEIDNKSLTHRPDLWGHYGMAREVAAIAGGTLSDPVKMKLLPRHGDAAIAVDIEDYEHCPRYSALVFENAAVGPSPQWLQARLESIGLNPINNLVDVTNYVLAELPQPMHAFDADKLEGGTIFVRRAAGESIRALNGETYKLDDADLVIADAGGPIAIAGVIGGADSAISETTTRVVLESANFQAASVRLTSARHKLRTDASIRFEKSLDRENTLRGIARAIELLHEVSPGIRIRGGVADSRGPLPLIPPIALSAEIVSRRLGKPISQEEIVRILAALGFGITETAPGLLMVTVPSWRATKDISFKEDLVEEIGRIVGYDEIVPAAPLVACTVPPANPMRGYLRSVRRALAAQGFTEVYNYSFANEHDAKGFSLAIEKHMVIRNPIAADLTHLRASLLPGLFRNIAGNVLHLREFRIFEIGSEIHPQPAPALPEEVEHAAAAIYSEHGNERQFFELKRVVECVFPGATLSAAEAHAYEHPARAAEIQWRGVAIGRIFELHPALLEAEGIAGRAALFDADLRIAQRLTAAHEVKYRPPRKYPTSGFDLSVVADLRTPSAEIERSLAELGGDALASIEFVRQYSGPPLPEGNKSVSYHLEAGALDRTLTNDEVTAIRDRMIEGMRQLGFELRV